MDKALYKFYDLENLTQEDLNKLALERNIYKSIIDNIKEIVNKVDYDKWELQMTSIEKIMKIQKLLEEVDKGGEQ